MNRSMALKRLLIPERALVFRLTHIENIPWILENGLWCPSAGKIDPAFHQIGKPDLIERRRTRDVNVPPFGTLSDYVPFYFTPKSIMQNMIVTGYGGVPMEDPESLVFLVASLRELARDGYQVLFTNAHAVPKPSKYSSNLADLESYIDWELLRHCDFSTDPNDPDKKSRYQAEALVHRHVRFASLLGIACRDQASKSRLKEELDSREMDCRLEIRKGWYFK